MSSINHATPQHSGLSSEQKQVLITERWEKLRRQFGGQLSAFDEQFILAHWDLDDNTIVRLLIARGQP